MKKLKKKAEDKKKTGISRVLSSLGFKDNK